MIVNWLLTKLSYYSKKSPVLKSPDYEKPFKLIIDSSDVGTGSVLSFRWIRSPCQLFFKEILKISKELFSGRKRNIRLSFSLGTFRCLFRFNTIQNQGIH